jgi:uncharacterized alkaline shock family protein YloU
MAETRSELTSDAQTQTAQAMQPGISSAMQTSPAIVESAGPQGRTTIADGVVAKIAGLAAREIEGVKDLVTTGAGAAISGLASRVTGGSQRSQGVSVEVGQREAAVDLNLVMYYGVSIRQVADAVRTNVINRVEAITGLAVKEVNIAVLDLYFPQEEATQQQPRVQ